MRYLAVILYCLIVTLFVIVLEAIRRSAYSVGDKPKSSLTNPDEVNLSLAFDNIHSLENIANRSTNEDAVDRRRDFTGQLTGPLYPVDCNRFQRYCLKSDNCNLLCKDAAVTSFTCSKGICVEESSSNSNNPPSVDSNCDTKNGEYGLLIGYNELGVALWQCVQLYPAFADRKRYCENGVLNIDARVREPSYRDCICPAGNLRIVYRESVLGQVVNGLPHCVTKEVFPFYSLAYVEV